MCVCVLVCMHARLCAWVCFCWWWWGGATIVEMDVRCVWVITFGVWDCVAKANIDVFNVSIIGAMWFSALLAWPLSILFTQDMCACTIRPLHTGWIRFLANILSYTF